MEKQIYFVRHGESDSNADGVYHGASALLTRTGETQAQEVARRIKRIGVDALIASPQARTRATADIIAAGTGLVVEESDLFIERRRPSAMHERRYDDPEISAMGKEMFEGYATESHRHSDEENFHDLKKRLGDALAFLATHPAERICVVTHGVFLVLLMGRVLVGDEFNGKEAQRALRTLFTGNTGVTHLTYESPAPYRHWLGSALNEWRIITWNDRAHLG